MTDLELLVSIGDADDRYVQEAQAWRTGRKRNPVRVRRVLLVAAVVAAVLAMVGFAAIVFDLQGLVMGQFGREGTSDYLSLQGFSGSKNYLAAQEWQEFLDTYDPDGSLKQAAWDAGFTAPAAYESYLCDTEEMVQKAEEICHKYGLNPLGALHFERDMVSVLDKVGVNSVFAHPEKVQVIDSEGYWFVDGSFSLSCLDFCLPHSGWDHPISSQYRCVMKTAFDGVYLNVWDADEYDQWTYTNKEGTQLLLALSETHGLIAMDGKDYFATVSILPHSMDKASMERADLEAVADALTFAYTPQSLERQTENTISEGYTPGYELFEGVFLPVAEGRCGDTMDEVAAVLTQLGYEYRLSEGMLTAEDKKTGKWLSGTLTNQNVTVELADLVYCHVEGDKTCRVKVTLYTGTPGYSIQDPDQPFLETPVDSLEQLKETVYSLTEP